MILDNNKAISPISGSVSNRESSIDYVENPCKISHTFISSDTQSFVFSLTKYE